MYRRDKYGTIITCRFCKSRNFEHNHHPSTCRTCYRCGVVGHNARDCGKKPFSPRRVPEVDNTHLLFDGEPVALDVEKVRKDRRSLSAWIVVAQFPSSKKVRRLIKDNVVYSAKIRRLRNEVTSYQTPWSGLTSIDLSEQAVPLTRVQEKLTEIFKDRLVVGIGLEDDLQSLGVNVPKNQRYDFIDYFKDDQNQPIGLKLLAYAMLGKRIQNFSPSYDPDRCHDPVIDSVATIKVYKQSRELNNFPIDGSYQWVRNIVDDALSTGQIIPK